MLKNKVIDCGPAIYVNRPVRNRMPAGVGGWESPPGEIGLPLMGGSSCSGLLLPYILLTLAIQNG